MPPFTERQFAAWMGAWADMLADRPAWRNLVHYRGVSAVDVGYMEMYFPVLAAVRRAFGVEPAAAERRDGTNGLSRLRRLAGRVRGGELTVAAGVRIAFERFDEWQRMKRAPVTLPRFDNARSALVVRAAANATGFPVLQSLRNDFGFEMLFASWSRTVTPRVQALDLPYVHLADVYRRQLVRWQTRHAESVRGELMRLDGRLPAQLLSDIVDRPIDIDLQPLLSRVCTDARVQTDLCDDLLSQTSPAVVVLFNEVSLRERTAARVAAQRGIRTAAVQHGLFIGYVYRSLATDLMVVWGSEPREFWIARGCPAERVVSVGGFGHENWTPQVQSAVRRHGVGSVLILGQNPDAFIAPSVYAASVQTVLDAVRRLPDVHFTIKPHPGEDPAPYREAAGLPNVSLRTGLLADVIRDANAVVTIFSTAGVEAMLAGVPVIVLNASADDSLAPYISSAVEVRDGAGLAAAVSRILSDAAYRVNLAARGEAYAQRYFGPLDGRAARRAAAAIDRLACGAGDARAAGRMAIA